MSFQSFDKLLHKLQKIEGKLLGPSFDVYRVDETIGQGYLTPFSSSYKIATISASFAYDEGYMKNPGTSLPKARVGMDGQQIQAGDVFVNSTYGTYFMLSRAPVRPFEAIQANSRITIESFGNSSYGDGQTTEFRPGAVSTGTVIAQNLAACVLGPGSETIDQGFVPARTNRSATQQRYEIYFWMPEGRVNRGDVVTLSNGVKIELESAFFFPSGYKCIGSENR